MSPVRASALVVALTVTAAVLLQRVCERGGEALIAALVAAAIGLASGALLLRRRWSEVIGGALFASLVLAALAIAATIAASVPQQRGSSALDSLGLAPPASTWPGLDGVARTVWFGSLLALLACGLLLAVVRRWPFGRSKIGFVAAHVGLLLVLLGGALSSQLTLRGELDLRAGQPPVATALVHRPRGRSGHSEPLGCGVALVVNTGEGATGASQDCDPASCSRLTLHCAGETRETQVAVNAPLVVGSWRYYLVRRDPRQPALAGLAVVRDPGLVWVGSGLVVTSVGVGVNLARRWRRRPATDGAGR